MMAVFSIFDSKAGVYSQPVFAVSAGAAVRSFEDAVNDPSTVYAKHPGDYTLFYIGRYDDATGFLSHGNDGHQNLGNGLQFRQQELRLEPGGAA